MVEPMRWAMIEGEPDSRSVDIVEPFDLLERVRRDTSEIAASCLVRPESGRRAGIVRARPDQIRRHRLRGRRAARLRPRVTDVQIDFQLLAREVAQVGRAVEL